MNDAPIKPDLTLVSALDTNTALILKNISHGQSDPTLASSLRTNAVFILENHAPKQPNLNIASCLETNVAFILENNAPDLILVSSLETLSSLLPFPTTASS